MPRGQKFPLEARLRAMREVDNGVPVGVVCRKVGMVEKTFYRYREKYAGMKATEARRLRELEEENQRLKKRNRPGEVAWRRGWWRRILAGCPVVHVSSGVRPSRSWSAAASEIATSPRSAA